MVVGANLLHRVADHFHGSIWGQIEAMALPGEAEAVDFSTVRNDVGAAALDQEIQLLRDIEDLVGTEERKGPLWLRRWIDEWPSLSRAEIEALTRAASASPERTRQ